MTRAAAVERIPTAKVFLAFLIGIGVNAVVAREASAGADAALPDVLMSLATCARWDDTSGRCAARFTDLAH